VKICADAGRWNVDCGLCAAASIELFFHRRI
jgi:hypothetical protein